ncbi:hypothetical protein NDU88_005054 [Pleurodeles waltl]|uniref:Uncharacterized protein n=1 Tax=Pleurodeles waltl TaxID=8319 RepID=A0AAV7VKI6_PLEWA|nr:hypothetical protein NDU88_005054 [Pleurodeles waltl]
MISQTGEGTETELEKSPEVPAHEDQDLQHILAAMQQSLTQIDGKIDSLSYCMDRMSERLDKQAERLDQAERRVSAVDDGQTALATGQLKISTELDTLRHKMDDLESRSQRNNLRILRPFPGQRSACRSSFSTSAASSSKRSAICSLVAPRGRHAVSLPAEPHVMDALLRSGEQSVVSGPRDPT